MSRAALIRWGGLAAILGPRALCRHDPVRHRLLGHRAAASDPRRRRRLVGPSSASRGFLVIGFHGEPDVGLGVRNPKGTGRSRLDFTWLRALAW